jgi:hypothetical protein
MRTSFHTPPRVFETPPEPFTDEYARRCHRLLRMVGVLHGKGFQGLRVFPYLHPNAYRIELYPVAYARADGVKHRLDDEPDGWDSPLVARHTGANGAKFFEWEDAESLNAQQLAIRFIERFPELCREAYRLDYAYAGWFATLLAHCDYGYLPYLFGEYEEEIGTFRMQPCGGNGLEYFPLPPNSHYGHTLAPEPQPRWLNSEC